MSYVIVNRGVMANTTETKFRLKVMGVIPHCMNGDETELFLSSVAAKMGLEYRSPCDGYFCGKSLPPLDWYIRGGLNGDEGVITFRANTRREFALVAMFVRLVLSVGGKLGVVIDGPSGIEYVMAEDDYPFSVKGDPVRFWREIALAQMYVRE